MQSLIKLGEFIHDPQNARVCRKNGIHKATFTSYHEKIQNVQHLDELSVIRAEIGKIIGHWTSNNQDDREDGFSKLPEPLFAPILDCLAFEDVIAFERVNRETFNFVRQYGAKVTGTKDFNQMYLLMSELPAHVYKLDRYRALKQLDMCLITIDSAPFLNEFVRNNHKLEQFDIHCQSKTALRGIFEMISTKSSIKKLVIHTRIFDLDLLELLEYTPESVQITAAEIYCQSFSSVLAGAQSIKFQCERIVDPQNMLQNMLQHTPNLRSLHRPNDKLIKISLSTCAQLEEICLYYVDALIEPMMRFRNVLLPKLKRIMVRNPHIIVKNLQFLMQNAPQIESIFIRCPTAEITPIQQFIQNIVDCIVLKNDIQFCVYLHPFGAHLCALAPIIEYCVEHLKSFMFVCRTMSVNANFRTSIDLLDQHMKKAKWNQDNIQDENGIYDYEYYRDKVPRNTKYGSYVCQSFIFRKMMRNAVPDHFQHNCDSCDFPAIF